MDIDDTWHPHSYELSIILNVDSFINTCKSHLATISEYKKWYKTKHIFVPFGGDFYFRNYGNVIRYLDAFVIFIKSNNLSGRYASDDSRVDIRITTLKNFFDAVRDDIQSDVITYEKEGDFYPLIEMPKLSNQRAPWTGYFTTNPFTKKTIRSFCDMYRGLRSVSAVKLAQNSELAIELLDGVAMTEETEWIVAANQHHDTITGTSRNFVNNHYLERQEINSRKSRVYWWALVHYLLDVITPSGIQAHIPLKYDFDAQPYDEYYKAELTQAFFDMEQLYVDEHGWDIKFYGPYKENFHLKAEGDKIFLVMGQAIKGKATFRFTSETPNIGMRVNSTTPDGNATFENLDKDAVFIKEKLYELEVILEWLPFEVKLFEFFTVTASAGSEASGNRKLFTKLVKDIPAVLPSTSSIDLHFDGNDLRVIDTQTGIQFGVGLYGYRHQISYSPSDDTNFVKSYHLPGKYIFTTTSQEPELLQPDSATYRVNSETGEVVAILDFKNEIYSLYFHYNPRAKQSDRFSTRFFSKSLPNSNLEICIRYHTNIKNDKTFYTDSNGLYAMKRTRGENGPYIENNYYPLTKFLYMEDSTHRFSVMVDRSEGGTSPADGLAEVMVNRVTANDDSRGAAENANENKDILVHHMLVIESLSDSESSHE